jgi:hypothetical protein
MRFSKIADSESFKGAFFAPIIPFPAHLPKILGSGLLPESFIMKKFIKMKDWQVGFYRLSGLVLPSSRLLLPSRRLTRGSSWGRSSARWASASRHLYRWKKKFEGLMPSQGRKLATGGRECLNETVVGGSHPE